MIIDKNLIANPTDFLPNRKFQTIAFSYLFINIIFVIIEIGKLSIHISILIKTEHLDGQPPYIFRPERQLHIALLRNNGICLDKYPEPLLTDYISEKNKRRFSRVEKQYANCSIHYQLITEKIFDSFHRNIDYLVSPVSYYRYIIPELYPQLDKALYLDGDLVVNGSLEKLWDTDITDYLCAGAHDLWVENINYKPQIGFSSDELYINAGVLLLNIPKMREEKIYEKLCETTISLGKQIQFQDQDIINIVCRGRVKELPERYNFTTENAIKHPEERDRAVIVHYTGKMKPWSIWDCPNPQSRLYFDYLKKTPYKNDIWSYRLKRSKYKIVRRFKKIFGIKSR